MGYDESNKVRELLEVQPDLLQRARETYRDVSSRPGEDLYALALRRRRAKCERFIPFDADISVCANCGRLAARHNDAAPGLPPRYLPYRDALIRWFISRAGIDEYYGGYNDIETLVVRLHLQDCGVDMRATPLPSLEAFHEFAGTEADPSRYLYLQTRVTCSCGLLSELQLVFKTEITFGELLWQVLEAGEVTE